MRIGLMLRHIDEGGGPGEYTRNLLPKLLALDQRNEYYLLYANDRHVRDYEPFPNSQSIVLPSTSRALWDQIMVPRQAQRLGLDVVFNLKHTVPIMCSCARAFVLHGADWFVYPQNYYLFDRLYHSLSMSFYLRKATRIVCVSDDTKTEAITRLGLSPDKLVVIHPGVSPDFERIEDPAKLANVRRKYRLPERFCLFVSRIYPMKNLGGIISAYAKLRGCIPQKLVIAGKPSFKAERDLKLIAHYSLERDVILTGWIDRADFPALYSLADVFLLPSFYEGFGIPLIEAMACGCPVVTSTKGSCPEVVGDAGLLVDPYEPDSIAQAILRILEDPALAVELRARGPERAKRFTWEACAQKTLAMLESLAPGRHG